MWKSVFLFFFNKTAEPWLALAGYVAIEVHSVQVHVTVQWLLIAYGHRVVIVIVVATNAGRKWMVMVMDDERTTSTKITMMMDK